MIFTHVSKAFRPFLAHNLVLLQHITRALEHTTVRDSHGTRSIGVREDYLHSITSHFCFLLLQLLSMFIKIIYIVNQIENNSYKFKTEDNAKLMYTEPSKLTLLTPKARKMKFL